MNKKYKTLALIIILLVIVVFFIIRANSFVFALKNEGLTTGDIHTVEEHDYDANGREFKVVQTTSKSGELALALLTKNQFGFWSVTQCDVATADKQRDSVRIGWIQDGGAKRFTHTENAIFEQEWHLAYCGANAIKRIEIFPEQMPANVTVNIQQDGELYWIHVISFAEGEVLNDFDLMTILEENGCIQ